MIINSNIQGLSNFVLELTLIIFSLWAQMINTLRIGKEFVIPNECYNPWDCYKFNL